MQHRHIGNLDLLHDSLQLLRLFFGFLALLLTLLLLVIPEQTHGYDGCLEHKDWVSRVDCCFVLDQMRCCTFDALNVYLQCLDEARMLLCAVRCCI